MCAMIAGVEGLKDESRDPDYDPDEVGQVLDWLPWNHISGSNVNFNGALMNGATFWIDGGKPTPALFGETVRNIREVSPQVIGTAPIALAMLAEEMEEDEDLLKAVFKRLRSIGYGGAPSAPELVRKIREVFGAEPGNGWGMTETSATVTVHGAEDYEARPESCGPPVATADLKIMSPDGSKELPVGEVGELWARGPMVVQEYWQRPEATEETFVDGWVKTGDLARLDEEGFCFIVDRAKDIIIRGGENIYSSEVENVLYDHPAVTDAALIGMSFSVCVFCNSLLCREIEMSGS